MHLRKHNNRLYSSNLLDLVMDRVHGQMQSDKTSVKYSNRPCQKSRSPQTTRLVYWEREKLLKKMIFLFGMLFFPTILYKKKTHNWKIISLLLFITIVLVHWIQLCSFLFISLDKFITASSISQILIERENRRLSSRKPTSETKHISTAPENPQAKSLEMHAREECYPVLFDIKSMDRSKQTLHRLEMIARTRRHTISMVKKVQHTGFISIKNLSTI